MRESLGRGKSIKGTLGKLLGVVDSGSVVKQSYTCSRQAGHVSYTLRRMAIGRGR